MAPYARHVFICVNKRAADDPRGCCAAKGSEEIRAAFKSRIKARGLNTLVRANAAGCLDLCARGPTVVIYPEGVWYVGVKVSDVEEIVEKHIVGGEVVARLQLPGGGDPAARLPRIDPPRREEAR